MAFPVQTRLSSHHLSFEQQEHVSSLDEKLRSVRSSLQETQLHCSQQKQSICELQAKNSQQSIETDGLRRRIEELQQVKTHQLPFNSLTLTLQTRGLWVCHKIIHICVTWSKKLFEQKIHYDLQTWIACSIDIFILVNHLYMWSRLWTFLNYVCHIHFIYIYVYSCTASKQG